MITVAIYIVLIGTLLVALVGWILMMVNAAQNEKWPWFVWVTTSDHDLPILAFASSPQLTLI